MEKIIWSDEFSVGVWKFDEDHKIIADLINQLHDDLAEGARPPSLGPLFETLMEYARDHFQREERLMEKHGYPWLEDHRLEHDDLKLKMLDYKRRYEENEADVEAELLTFLTNWWHIHILIQDMGYKNFFKEKGVGEIPGDPMGV